jgi:hypothetical protein
MHASKSFDIRTARDYLDQLVHQTQKDLQGDPGSTRTAIAAAIFCWHLHDWVWAQHINKNKELQAKLQLAGDRKENWRNYLRNQCKELTAIEGIATGSKHVQADHKEPSSTTSGWVQKDFVNFDWVQTSLSVEFHGKSVQFTDILDTCVRYWDDFFQTHLP